MLRKLWLLTIALGLVIPASAATKSGSISGYVRNTAGTPQMGAVVEILGAAMRARIFTDDKGFFSVPGLVPGTYSVKVSAPFFLPTLRERIGLRSGATAIVNVTLNTLFEAIQMVPLRTPAEDEDWKWTLRSATNRPILRVLDDGTSVLVDKKGQDLKGSLSFVAGSASQGYGSASDMSTGFSVERSIFSSGSVALLGNVGHGSGSSIPNAVLRTSYSHRLSDGSMPQVAFTVRRLAAPDPTLPALQAMALTTSDRFTVGDVLELRFGSELQTIQFMGRVNAAKPFGSADLHLSPNTVLEYQYASAEPNTRLEKGFDSAPADLSESGPRMSMAGFAPLLERAHHHELSVSQRFGKTSVQFAVYSDRVTNPALTGVGELGLENGEVLPDIYSGTFSYQGSDLNTGGVRAVVQRKFAADLVGTLDYAYGGVLDLSRPDTELQNARQFLQAQRRHALAAKLSGTLPRAKTKWIASYRWVNGQALTPVDMFNISAGQADPFLNIFVRQPIPCPGLAGHVDALVDVRNLLAQGYVPVIANDGRTVYLVQSARSVRGGLAFTF